MQTMMQLSRQNPQLNQIMQMTNGKTPAQMEQMVRQAAQQRGVDLNQLAQQLGIKLPG
jgi:ribosome-binding protein aMBF1 (putative translation factor)